ncbi:class I SAM-dependent methyltransferase [Rhodohalobacter sulfatireducens]|uniref:Class I SAM-dependent methyltransferase n=1 Tax=Rhodohalobacter sulfatireducens TaxID=2911366 RepID=A0ABS9KGC5_9BACT|nr:class I SAM-dependent methyltransferase [Rhodohalobacter sulfatireducens]MCG2589919.1 class I SAM-dependent methyltransferase [Rhodohalobacter sulfatireducens]MDR9366361.1 class I SAM-dependent methyltransferase [Balneolaceae bacterium]MDR9408823.1 class I SAM-dependent methyltransferase [Balneolaceae bacterium]
MPLFLKERQEHLTEKMDQPDCDQALLFNTYQQFSTINRLISGWQRIYKKLIRPVLKDSSYPYSLLDIGCGGGDIINLIDRLAKKDGIKLQITGIEPDERAIRFLSEQKWPENISFKKSTSADLVQEGRLFDIVLSNHLMHHLKKPELSIICNDAEKLATQKIIFSDIERSDIGYISFKVAATPLFRKSFIVEDGLTSIKRSFRKDELQQALPRGWKVQRQFPFRLLAINEAS